MEKTIVTTGKTIDLAIASALEQLGLDRDNVSVQVLAQAKPGFLGFGAQPAKVQVTYEVPDPKPEPKAEAPKAEPMAEAPKSALSSASRSKPKPSMVKLEEAVKAEAPKAEKPKAEAPKAEPKAEKPKAEKVEKPKAPKAEKPRKEAAPAEPKVYAPAQPGSVEEKIEQFLKGLLEHMGSQAVPHAWKTEDDTYMVELTGEDLGYLIGRRGDTLDALQHLSNYAINRGVEGHIRINLDAEAYREKREDSSAVTPGRRHSRC